MFRGYSIKCSIDVKGIRKPQNLDAIFGTQVTTQDASPPSVVHKKSLLRAWQPAAARLATNSSRRRRRRIRLDNQQLLSRCTATNSSRRRRHRMSHLKIYDRRALILEDY